MLPPVLEIFVVWHPGDAAGSEVADELVAHYHGTAFSGLIGGAIEIYVRSEGWAGVGTAPRPIAGVAASESESAPAELTVVVPVVGPELVKAVEDDTGSWRDYLQVIVNRQNESSESVLVVPVSRIKAAVPATAALNRILGHLQLAATPVDDEFDKVDTGRLTRDIGQAITQFASRPSKRLTVFVSHTKHSDKGAMERHFKLLGDVRRVIAKTRLAEFFDASDLQPGRDWASTLESEAASSALLVVRTDVYASRQWCQREVRIAKQARMPVVTLDALTRGEERGSFLMDHVPRLAGPTVGVPRDEGTIARVLDQLVDECLKRALWDRQETLARGTGVDVAWWAAHAPEPVTFARWLTEATQNGLVPATGAVRVLHPDPPLGPDELLVLSEIAALAGLGDRLEVLTPRGLARRGGGV